MQYSKYLRPIATLSSIFLLSACSDITQLQNKNKYFNATLKPGVGLGNINLRVTSLREIKAQLGRNYKRETRGFIGTQCEFGQCIEGRKETITLNYQSLGFKFRFEQHIEEMQPEGALSVKEIQVNCVKNSCPYKGKTEKGIGLGNTRQQLKEAYGNPKRSPTNTWQWSYPKKGISFEIEHKYLAPMQDSDRIKAIIISKDLL